MAIRIVGLSGSVRKASRTTVLVRTVTERIAALTGGAPETIELADVAPVLFSALSRDQLREEGEAILARVETADLLVVGSPVYRASLTGVLKHLFDLVDHRALAGRPAVLLATGGSPHHGLVPDHQLRPLLAFFGALTLPTTIYAVESDFDGERLVNPAIAARIERVAEEASALAARIAPVRLLSPVAASART